MTLRGGATKEYVDTKINEALQSVYTYKGSVDTYDNLPNTGQKVGDVYNVIDTGNNYAWDGEAWDNLGGFIIPNPTLAGTEANLEGLQIGNTKYKVGGNNHLYRHHINTYFNDSAVEVRFDLYTTSATRLTNSTILDYLKTNLINCVCSGATGNPADSVITSIEADASSVKVNTRKFTYDGSANYQITINQVGYLLDSVNQIF